MNLETILLEESKQRILSGRFLRTRLKLRCTQAAFNLSPAGQTFRRLKIVQGVPGHLSIDEITFYGAGASCFLRGKLVLEYSR